MDAIELSVMAFATRIDLERGTYYWAAVCLFRRVCL